LTSQAASVRQKDSSSASPAANARAWRDRFHAAICDVIESWEHGSVVRATRYPHYYDFNAVRVEEVCDLDVDALVHVADDALAGLGHRRIDFDSVEEGQARRGEFEARGWTATRILWMRHERPPPPQEPDSRVELAPYETAQKLRVIWQADFSDRDAEAYHRQAREVALRRGVQVLVLRVDYRACGVRPDRA